MTKHCSVCNAENREEAQFCRACGSVFAAVTGHGSFGDEPSTENICSECGFRNKPDIRYCANCGMNLSGSTDIAPLGDLAPLPENAEPASSPPPISYASFATVEPYPPAPAVPSGYPPPLEDTAPLDIPDPDARIAIRQLEAQDTAPAEFMQAAEPPAPNQAKRVVAVGVAALVVAAIAAWTFLGRESAGPPAAPVVPAVAPTVAPVASPQPAPIASAAAPIIVDVPAVAAPAASAVVVESAPVVPPAASAPVPDASPAAAAPLPKLSDPVPAVTAADADAKRLAAEKARRDKAARDKAERDARAKALAEQREQAAAAARAEQDAQARKRAEEAQRARPVAAPAASTPASTQPRGVRETCAGRGTIAEAVCQSRLCSAAEHANEPICRQIREADERRRNLLN